MRESEEDMSPMEGFLTWRLVLLRSLAFPRPVAAVAGSWLIASDPRGAVHRITVAGPCGNLTRLPFDNTGVVAGEHSMGS